MYCSGCGSPIAQGLSFCNRCGTSLKERSSGQSKSLAATTALVLAMVIVAISAMGLLLGGPIALKQEGQFGEELIVLFMFLTFFIGSVTEILLYRQLSRLTAQPKITFNQAAAIPPAPAADYYAPQPHPRALNEQRTLAEPIPSVTENTTRTLGYSRNEPGGKDYS
jgi:hypothetical protein